VAFEIQKRRTLEERAAIIKKMGQVIDSRLKEISETITFEMGKPIVDAEAEVKKVVSFCNHYGEELHPLRPYQVKTAAKKHTLVKYLPLGGIYILAPFNFPFYLNFKGGLPSLLLGNTLLARNADSCPEVGRLIEEVMIEAGFKNGEYQNVYTNYTQMEQIFQHPSIQGVSFTGSSKTGALIG
jgi:succinate-semialdehyde dehydrogenase / glutarate-semialdehyde dehydrogenase